MLHRSSSKRASTPPIWTPDSQLFTPQKLLAGKRIRMDFLTSKIYQAEKNLHPFEYYTRQQEALQDYIEENHKDFSRYQQIKFHLKTKYFDEHHPNNIRYNWHSDVNPQSKNQQKSSVKNRGALSFKTTKKRKQSDILSKSLKTPPLLLKSKITSLDYSKQVDDLLTKSKQIQQDRQKIRKQKAKMNTRTEVNKKNAEILRQEKDLILQIIQKSQSEQVSPRKPVATTKLKYGLDYIKYLKKKSLANIQKDFYEMNVRKSTRPVEKFQDFILNEVKFKNVQHKDQLQEFFRQIRGEFRRIERNH